MIALRSASVSALFLIGSQIGYPTLAEAQSCLPSDESTAVALHGYAVRLATYSDSVHAAKRVRYDIPQVPQSEVEIISNSNTCKKAGRAYKQSLGLSGKAPAVTVVRIGTRYIVVHPEPEGTESEFTAFIVYDSDFNELAKFAA